MNYFIIPGNPPALHFYQIWKQEIQAAHPQTSIMISPYPRYPLKQSSEDYFKLILNFHAEQLQAFQKTVNQPVTVIGHSLGGWMALNLLSSHEASIDSCILLYPFLRAPSLKGKIILKSLHQLHKNSSFEKWVLKVRPLCEKINRDLRYVTDEELRSTLNLAHHEYVMIGKVKSLPKLDSPLYQKIRLIYCDDDTWCADQTLRNMIPYVSHLKTNAKHGFIVSKHQREVVFRNIQELNI
jgi:pimeloyl-ACP methyl ester carboxylesterase